MRGTARNLSWTALVSLVLNLDLDQCESTLAKPPNALPFRKGQASPIRANLSWRVVIERLHHVFVGTRRDPLADSA